MRNLALLAPPIMEEWERLYYSLTELERAKRAYGEHCARVMRAYKRNMRAIEAQIKKIQLDRGVRFAVRGDLGMSTHHEHWNEYQQHLNRIAQSALTYATRVAAERTAAEPQLSRVLQ